MSKTLRFYGASDDLFEVTGAICEEIGCFSKPGVYHLKSVEGELHVVGYYQDTGIWSVGIAPVAEGAPVPAWPSTYQVHENGYSPLLTLEVPDDTQLVMADEDED